MRFQILSAKKFVGILENVRVLVRQRNDAMDMLAHAEAELAQVGRRAERLQVQVDTLDEHFYIREHHHLNYRAEERKRHRNSMAALKGQNTKLRNKLEAK